MKILAFLTDPPVVAAILLHLELPHRPPPISPARGPPQGDFLLDQTSEFDPAEAPPIPTNASRRCPRLRPAHFAHLSIRPAQCTIPSPASLVLRATEPPCLFHSSGSATLPPCLPHPTVLSDARPRLDFLSVWRRFSFRAYSGPTFRHHCRMVSWVTVIPQTLSRFPPARTDPTLPPIERRAHRARQATLPGRAPKQHARAPVGPCLRAPRRA